jgi:hypothetical protein
MVYQIYTNGENVDAEFGQPLNVTQFFKGKYGDALKKAEEFLSLIDIGSVSVKESDKLVYIAVKDLGEVSRLELKLSNK